MATVIGTQKDELLRGDLDTPDRIFGLAGDDTLVGFGGGDRLIGGKGDDVLRGDADYEPFGRDTLTGGRGEDLFEWRLGTAATTAGAPDLIRDFEGAGAPGGDMIDLLPDLFDDRALAFGGFVDAAPTIGSSFGSGDKGYAEIFVAFDGDTTLIFADFDDDGLFEADDFAVRLSGHIQIDQFDFEWRDRLIVGSKAAESLVGAGSADAISGLRGADTIKALGGDDVLFGGAGDDRVFAAAGDDTIFAGDGVDVLRGGSGEDRLVGGPGSGADTLYGGGGDDVVDLTKASFGGDAIGGSGDDTLIGSDVSISFSFLDGDRGRDLLLAGENGAIMRGGPGRDRLVGSADTDVMTGGDPTQPIEDGFDGVRDVYVFGEVWGDDLINGFEDGVDKIDLRANGAEGLTFELLDIEQDARGRTVVSFSDDVGTILLAAFDSENLTASDFIFG